MICECNILLLWQYINDMGNKTHRSPTGCLQQKLSIICCFRLAIYCFFYNVSYITARGYKYNVSGAYRPTALQFNFQKFMSKFRRPFFYKFRINLLIIIARNANCSYVTIFWQLFYAWIYDKKYGKLYINGKLIRYWIMLYWIWKV